MESSTLNFILLLLLNIVPQRECWQYFTRLSDITLVGSPPEQEVLHSDYIYGDCKREDISLSAHVHKDHLEVLGKLIVRGWLLIRRMPTCILLRARSYEIDLFRSTAFNFQFCVPRVTYCHTKNRVKYYYYEWYLPYEMVGGMNWDIYFYGPEAKFWQ